MVKDKLNDRTEEFLCEAKKMDEAILEAKNKFLTETLIPFPPKLEAKFDEKSDESFSDGDIDKEKKEIENSLNLLEEEIKVKEKDTDLIKLGNMYSKIFMKNKVIF